METVVTVSSAWDRLTLLTWQLVRQPRLPFQDLALQMILMNLKRKREPRHQYERRRGQPRLEAR